MISSVVCPSPARSETWLLRHRCLTNKRIHQHYHQNAVGNLGFPKQTDTNNTMSNAVFVRDEHRKTDRRKIRSESAHNRLSVWSAFLFLAVVGCTPSAALQTIPVPSFSFRRVVSRSAAPDRIRRTVPTIIMPNTQTYLEMARNRGGLEQRRERATPLGELERNDVVL